MVSWPVKALPGCRQVYTPDGRTPVTVIRSSSRLSRHYQWPAQLPDVEEEQNDKRPHRRGRSQTAPSPAGSGPHRIHGYFGPPVSTTQTTRRSVQPFLYGSGLCPINRHRSADRPCHDGNNRPHLCTLCMRCGLTVRRDSLKKPRPLHGSSSPI